MVNLKSKVLGLKDQIFGELGFSSDIKLSSEELKVFRKHISSQWVDVIKTFYPELSDEARTLGIANYHTFSEKIDHNKIWPKCNRVLRQDAVEEIKQLPFIQHLKEELGDFLIADIYDTEQHLGKEEVYWRLVRPNTDNDIGPFHADGWFHSAFNNGNGMFKADETTLKIWIPIFCEPNKSGLAIVPGSHLQEWKYHMVTTNKVPRPVLDEDTSQIEAKLIPTEPGNMLIFNDKVLHGGVINKGSSTRVSAEITLVLK